MSANVRVLVIDDDHEDCRLVQTLLSDAKRARFVVDSAHTSERGLEKLSEETFDVVLLDHRLPGDIQGLDVLAAITRLHYRIPVILITAHGDRKLQTQALEAGATDYLEKGLFSTEVLARSCMYAIGLYQQNANDGHLDHGHLMDQLVGLTRESVTAQTNVTQEIRGMRKDLAEDTKRIEKKVDEIKDMGERHKAEVLAEFKKTWWGRSREGFALVIKHPIAALVILLALITLLVLIVLLVQFLDIEKIKALSTGAAEGVRLSYG